MLEVRLSILLSNVISLGETILPWKLIRKFPTIKFKNSILSSVIMLFFFQEKKKIPKPKKMQRHGIKKEIFNECCKKFILNSKFFITSPNIKHIKVSNRFLMIGFFLLLTKKNFSEKEISRTQQNRMEYEAVKTKPQKSPKDRIMFFKLLFNKKKIIMSLEKNPEKKNNPIILRRLKNTENDTNSDLIINFIKRRLSWLWFLIIIQYPMLMNKSALKIAWIIRCRNPIKGLMRQQLVIINPRCLKVERAITFFKSFSKRANIPANNRVIILLIIITFIKKFLLSINKKNRIIR